MRSTFHSSLPMSRLRLSFHFGLLAAARCAVGGQAVLEGVLMRSPRALAIAVRRPDGQIVVNEQDWHSVTEKWRVLKAPLLRGIVMLFETMANGYQALTWSANQAASAELETERAKSAAAGTPVSAESAAKTDQLVGWALAGTMIFALAMGIGLFVVLPHLITAYVNPLFGLSSDFSSTS